MSVLPVGFRFASSERTWPICGAAGFNGLAGSDGSAPSERDQSDRVLLDAPSDMHARGGRQMPYSELGQSPAEYRVAHRTAGVHHQIAGDIRFRPHQAIDLQYLSVLA